MGRAVSPSSTPRIPKRELKAESAGDKSIVYGITESRKGS